MGVGRRISEVEGVSWCRGRVISERGTQVRKESDPRWGEEKDCGRGLERELWGGRQCGEQRAPWAKEERAVSWELSEWGRRMTSERRGVGGVKVLCGSRGKGSGGRKSA